MYRRLSVELGVSDQKVPLAPVYCWVLFFGKTPPDAAIWVRSTVVPKYRRLHHVDMFQLVEKMLQYLSANPLAKIGIMFDDTGNKHCVYITYIIYTDDDDTDTLLESVDAVAEEHPTRNTKVERLLLSMAAPLLDKRAKNAGALNVWLMEHFNIPLDRVGGSVADHAALGK